MEFFIYLFIRILGLFFDFLGGYVLMFENSEAERGDEKERCVWRVVGLSIFKKCVKCVEKNGECQFLGLTCL